MCYLKEILILNSFSLEDKDPRFTRLKLGLALRSLSKGLFYIRAMLKPKSGKMLSKIICKSTSLSRGKITDYDWNLHTNHPYFNVAKSSALRTFNRIVNICEDQIQCD